MKQTNNNGMGRGLLSLVFMLVGTVLACGPAVVQPLPTAMPLAATPTSTLVPTATFVPTNTPVPSPTPLPTNTPLPTRTPVPIVAAINITTPREEVDVFVGGNVTLSGLAQIEPGEHEIVVQLVSTMGEVLTETVTSDIDSNVWQIEMGVPLYVTGPGQLLAGVRDGAGNVLAVDSTQINLILPPDPGERYLDVYRPESLGRGVAGQYLYFDGWGQRPGSSITVALFIDNCQNEVANQRFTMNGSGYWQAYLLVPRGIEGTGCGVVYFGERGNEENWREGQRPVEIFPRGADEAAEILLSSPRSEEIVVRAGETLNLYGVAYHPDVDSIYLSMVMDSGLILAQQSILIQDYGYWEAAVNVPLEIEGVAEMRLMLDPLVVDEFRDVVRFIEVLPAEE
ncbi:MAG TPA: hypothetical protein VLL52_25725 [Anaerolineae bacterium]|nr:hypothetical protein [Anaerolineae bacterium]